MVGEGGARCQEEVEIYRPLLGSCLPKIPGYEKERMNLLIGD